MCLRRCSHCGNIGTEIEPHLVHIGGRNYVLHYYCSDQASCWSRWEQQMVEVAIESGELVGV